MIMTPRVLLLLCWSSCIAAFHPSLYPSKTATATRAQPRACSGADQNDVAGGFESLDDRSLDGIEVRGGARVERLVTSDGQQNFRAIKADARGRRIIELLGSLQAGLGLSTTQQKELKGLMRKGDTYDAGIFSTAHCEFKAAHNAIMARLIGYCTNGSNPHPPVFFLDGADMGSTLSLQAGGLSREQLFVANIFPETVAALTDSERRPEASLAPKQVVLGRAEDALAGPFATVPFVCYYLDGCGGMVAPLLDMVRGIFTPERPQPARFAVGFTLTLADPSGIPLPDREQEVLRTLATTARSHGFHMWHVADEPQRYLGENAENPPRMQGGTLTTWLVLESCS